MSAPTTPAKWSLERVVSMVYLLSQLIPVLIMLVFIVGTLLLSGSQMGYNEHPIFTALIPFPLFVVPAWFTYACAAIGLLTVVPLVVLTKAPEAPRLIGAFAYTCGAAIAYLAFAYFFPEHDSQARMPAEGTFGAHWFATVAAAVCIVVILTRLMQIGPEHDRLRKERFRPRNQA